MQGPRCDDHARRVHARVARVAFERRRLIEQFLDPQVLAVHPFELGLFLESLGDGDVELLGHQLGDAIHFGKRDFEHAADVLDRRLGFERPERDDLRDVPVLAAHIINDAPAPVLAQVDIDIGILASIGIGESLEEQAVSHGAGV